MHENVGVVVVAVNESVAVLDIEPFHCSRHVARYDFFLRRVLFVRRLFLHVGHGADDKLMLQLRCLFF